MKADAGSNQITGYEVTSASAHDSRALFNLFDQSCSGEKLFADSAYKSAAIDKVLEEIGAEMNLPHFGGQCCCTIFVFIR
ncbi:hypothetical protein MLD52_20955 [Puniceicoccaceae bacterium K14]|nr:hypothetical protein [Puniceicoccaceae bacterium K14]